ncbi:MAG: hypothetical protein WC829_01890 [Hyphomicrobium sp.]|jgi:hypothetical protein
MSISITINISDDDPYKANTIEEHFAALGFFRADIALARKIRSGEIKTGVSVTAGDTETDVAETQTATEAKQELTTEPAKPTRARRTKAQVEAEAKAEEPAKLAISTGEERIDPAAEADAEQDAADEAAEHATEEVEAALFTHNDLRNAMGAYVKAFGMAETLEDGPAIMVAALGEPPAGTDVWTASAVPVDKLGLAINAWLATAAVGKRFRA